MLRRLIDRIYGKNKPKRADDDTGTGAAMAAGQGRPATLKGDRQTDAPPSPQAPIEEAGADAGAGVPPAEGAEADAETVKARVIENLKKVYDPEIPVNIYELGLIYEVRPEASGMVYVQMTLTAPNCPAAGILPGQVESQARAAEGVRDVKLDLTFDPPWTPERMSEAARLELGML